MTNYELLFLTTELPPLTRKNIWCYLTVPARMPLLAVHESVDDATKSNFDFLPFTS